MEKSTSLFKVFNFFFPFTDFLYILQLEEYNNQRLLKWLSRFFWRRNFQVRDRLKYTKRARLTLGFIILLWLISLIKAIYSVGLPAILVWMVLIPLFVLIGNILISPYFESIKSRIRKKAHRKIALMSNLKIINVAGSYGKTTTKNFIYQLIRTRFSTQMIPGNINTPSGIADWVRTGLNENTQILVAELDTYEKGEIAKSSNIIPADIAVLTNIGDQHLERFKNEKNLAVALAEVYQEGKNNAQLVTNKETSNKIVIPKQMKVHLVDKLKLSTTAKRLSASNQVNLRHALKVAEILGIPKKLIEHNVGKLEIPERRQKLTDMYGYGAIDDSYNISFTTALAGIKTAKQEAKRRKKRLLVLTAGIPELSTANRDKNKKLGEILSREADQTIVLGSMFAEDIIASGLAGKMVKVKNLKEFLTKIKAQYPPSKWFLLHQPELGDLYY